MPSAQHAVAAGHAGGGDHHAEDEEELHVADAGERGGAARVDGLAAAGAHPPADERDHGRDLEGQDHGEQADLGEEEVVVHVVGRALLERTEGSEEAGDDPDAEGDAPPRVGPEDSLESLGIERAAQRAPPCPHRGQADGEAHQVKRGQDPGRGHALLPHPSSAVGPYICGTGTSSRRRYSPSWARWCTWWLMCWRTAVPRGMMSSTFGPCLSDQATSKSASFAAASA